MGKIEAERRLIFHLGICFLLLSAGVVFDSGDGGSHSVPVYEGYSLTHAVQRFPLGGADVTMHLKKVSVQTVVPGVCCQAATLCRLHWK